MQEGQHHLDEGVQLPLGIGAAGKLLLAFTNKDYEKFEEILKNGYAISRGERDSDIAALAVPIMNSNGTVRGALNISGLVSHFDEEFEKKFHCNVEIVHFLVHQFAVGLNLVLKLWTKYLLCY